MIDEIITHLQFYNYIADKPTFGGMGKNPRYEILNAQAVFSILSENGFISDHRAHRNGYISPRTKGTIEKYSGKFGNGFVIEYPNTKGTIYHDIEYFISICS